MIAPVEPAAGAMPRHIRDGSNVPYAAMGKVLLSAPALPPERSVVGYIGGAPVLPASARPLSWPSSLAPQGALEPASWKVSPAGSVSSTSRGGGRTDATGPGGRADTAAALAPPDATDVAGNDDNGCGTMPSERAAGKENNQSGLRADRTVPREDAGAETRRIVDREFPACPDGGVLRGGGSSCCGGARAEATFSQRRGGSGQGKSSHGDDEHTSGEKGEGAGGGAVGEGGVLGAGGEDEVGARGVPAAGGQTRGGAAGVAEGGEGTAGAEGVKGKEAGMGGRNDEVTPSAAERGIQPSSSACSGGSGYGGDTDSDDDQDDPSKDPSYSGPNYRGKFESVSTGVLIWFCFSKIHSNLFRI